MWRIESSQATVLIRQVSKRNCFNESSITAYLNNYDF